MKEQDAVLARWQQLVDTGAQGVLATVVKVEGSAYRRPGARMLIDADGGHVGTLSGGCLEGHLVKRAWWLTEREPAVVCRYDTAADEDAQWSFGLGCDGVIHVLLERIDGAVPSPERAAIASARQQMQAAATAVVIARRGANVSVGARRVQWPDGRGEGRLGDEALSRRVDADLSEAIAKGRSGHRIYALGCGEVEVFIEYLPPPPRLVIFGAGHDAVPLVRLAKRLGWHVTVADGRAHFARAERFPKADRVRVTTAQDPLAGCAVDGDCAVVVMTHSVTQDRALLRHLLPLDLPYLGQLGPRTRTDRLIDELASDGGIAPARARAGLHYPIGLDIGADNAEEIALAVIAEINAVRAGRRGGMLRERDGTVHLRDPQAVMAAVSVGGSPVAA